MPTAPPVRPVTIEDIRAARDRIRGVVTRTPLIRFLHGVPGAPEIWLKLENLQPINAFKLRGAANAVALLPEEERSKGVWTISAGNAGQGVAYAAREAGVPCTVVTIETAPETKVERMRALGATLVKAPFDACWNAMEERAFPGVEGTFVHPFDDHDFIAGNATCGLEILEDLPTVRTVITAIGGGGLITGVASALRALAPDVAVFGAEPETAAPGSISFAAGEARVFDGWEASFVDGAGAHVGADPRHRRRLDRGHTG
jgi:threonine dehydratase